MGFDEFLKNNRKLDGNYKERRYHDDSGYSHDSVNLNNKDGNQLKWSTFLEKIKNDKKLKRLVVLAGILIIAITITLIIVLWPVILKTH